MTSSSEDLIDLQALQRVIQTDQWKTDQDFFEWILKQYWRLLDEHKHMPEDFGTPDFGQALWNYYWGDKEEEPPDSDDDQFQEGGRLKARSPSPSITDAAKRTKLVDYSDSESEDESNPPTPGLQPGDFFDLSTPIETYVRKFKIHGKAYNLKFKNQDKIGDVSKVLLDTFEEVLRLAFEDGNPTDMIGLQIKHPSLNKGCYNVPFRIQSEMTAERILALWEMLVQSDEELHLDSQLEIVFTRIPQTRGGRPRENKWNHEAWMRKHSGNGGCFIKISNPGDSLCLARSLVVSMALVDKDTDAEVGRRWHALRRKRSPAAQTLQKELATRLMEEAGLGNHQGDCGENEIRKLQAVLQPEYQIKIFSSQCCNFLTYQGNIPSEKVLHIYHQSDDDGGNGHFLVITKPHVLFNRQHFCDRCNQGFNCKKRHKCLSKCYSCFNLNECRLTEWKQCGECSRWFRSEECFQNHLSVAQRTRGGKQIRINKSICQKFRRCTQCYRLLNTVELKRRNGGHRCGFVFCRTCKMDHKEGSQNECYMSPIVDKKKNAPSADGVEDGEIIEEEEDGEIVEGKGEEENLDGDERNTKIFFDFECRQERQIGENDFGPIYAHDPNLCVAVKICDLCKEKTRKREFGTCEYCGQNEWIFKGLDCKEKFCRWLFSESNRGSTAMAHNSKGYDSQFLLNYLIKETLVPSVISKGLCLLSLSFCSIRVIDSFNFLPMALAELPKAFGETELEKGYFPHHFNKLENANYDGPWPDAYFYGPALMKPSKRDAFYAWYSKQVGKVFNMEEEILRYCRSDVYVLMSCCLRFEELFFEVTSVKPFNVAVTLAAACMHVYRRNFLKPETIALIPPGGYHREEIQSNMALKWLMYISESQNIEIQHARNGGEKRISSYKVDGWDEANQTVYEFHVSMYIY